MAMKPRPFQQSRIKYANVADKFQQQRVMVSNKSKQTDTMDDRIKLWTTFYRLNYHRFIEHYFGLTNLHLFQKIMIFLMGISTYFITIASRGTSKSYISGLFACAEAVLNPNSIIVIVASTKKQAGLIITEKIQGDFMKKSPNLCREIKKVSTAQNDNSVTFHNGSRIIVVPATSGALGHRATCIIYEEFKLMKREVVEGIIRPFLINRQPEYLNKPEYAHLQEDGYKQLCISSAYFKSHNDGYMWKEMVKVAKQMFAQADDDKESKHIILGFDYFLSIFHRIKPKEILLEDKETMDEITFAMEYENIMFDESGDAYFKLEMFKKNQKIKQAFYPRRNLDIEEEVTDNELIKKVKGEIRVIGVDVASKGGKSNDNTIISCIRAIPLDGKKEGKGYYRQLVYMESLNGEVIENQSLRIKQLFVDFDANYIVLDTQNVGTPLLEMLSKETSLIESADGRRYPAFGLMDNLRKYTMLSDSVIAELKNHIISNNTIPVIYPVQGSSVFNDQNAKYFRSALTSGKFNVLLDLDKAKEYLSENNKGYVDAVVNNDSMSKAWYLHPYAQTNMAISECVNLDARVTSGGLQIKETSGSRKDRYSSMSYANYFISQLELDLLKESKKFDWSNYILY